MCVLILTCEVDRCKFCAGVPVLSTEYLYLQGCMAHFSGIVAASLLCGTLTLTWAGGSAANGFRTFPHGFPSDFHM